MMGMVSFARESSETLAKIFKSDKLFSVPPFLGVQQNTLKGSGFSDSARHSLSINQASLKCLKLGIQS